MDYRMQRVKTKANDSKDIREGIELFEEKVNKGRGQILLCGFCP